MTPEAIAIAVIFEDFEIDHTPDGWPAVKQMHLSAAAAELRRQHAEIERITAENEALLDRFANQLIPLTPGQCVDIADSASKMELSDNFLSDICKIVGMVEAAHGIGDKT